LRIEDSFMKPDSGHRTEVSVFYFFSLQCFRLNPHLKKEIA
jgi:hypothetical protein